MFHTSDSYPIPNSWSRTFRADVPDLYDLHDLYDPYNLHDPGHVSCVGSVLQYTDPAKNIWWRQVRTINRRSTLHSISLYAHVWTESSRLVPVLHWVTKSEHSTFVQVRTAKHPEVRTTVVVLYYRQYFIDIFGSEMGISRRLSYHSVPKTCLVIRIINTSYQKLPFGSGDYPDKLLFHQALN